MQMENKAILIYDGSCPLCRGARNWLVKRAKDNALTTVACQSAEDRCALDAESAERCHRAMCLLLPDGSMHSGVEALPHLMRRLKRWRWLGRMIAFPGVNLAARGVYAVVSRNRYLISRLLGLPAHQACCCGARQDQP